MKNSNQKRVLVLGVSEANSIGYAIAQKFIDQGARVLIAGRTESKLKQCL
jgi:2-hydroxycyclohexanecarboxyl-CoA dehydrogenase